MSILKKLHDFNSLSLRDLLEAREAYHRHLVHLQNVVGTAVGRYLVRRRDPDYSQPGLEWSGPRNRKRTLANSQVTKASVPCVLVFVDTWPGLAAMQARPEDFVPPRLYLPDDRVVPTCVVCADAKPIDSPPLDDRVLSRQVLGGGYPLLTEVQGQLRVGSVGCLVTDGHSVFALTNRHVAGPYGQVALGMAFGDRYRIGESRSPSIRHLAFRSAFPEWPVSSAVINLDAGLVLVDRSDDWSAQVYGLGKIGRLVDLQADTLTLDLIEEPVRAFGGAAGPLRGAVKGLFYQYRSVAGTDYMTDFLIGPRQGDETVPTRHGDSGTLWCFDTGPAPDDAVGTYRPFAMQWGGTNFVDETGQEQSQFALASNLSTILRQLKVEIIHDWNISPSETWGKMGHYQVGASACDLVSAPKLYQLMQRNRANIGLGDADRQNKKFPTGNSDFIALADVSDLWWKKSNVRGAREKPTHFADMDQASAQAPFAGKTLTQLYEADPASLDKTTWKQFYESLGITRSHMGSLPFRVQQFYDAMVGFAKKREVSRFVAAAGILAHYVGDAAQPLHASHLHHGANADESGVHAQYETRMMDKFRREIVSGVNTAVDGFEIASRFTGSQRAAEVTVELMQFAASVLAPRRIIDEYLAARQTSNTNDALWAALGDDTIALVVESAFYLAEIWESAWLEGNGESIGWDHMVEIPQGTLRTLYKQKSFVPSRYLEDM